MPGVKLRFSVKFAPALMFERCRSGPIARSPVPFGTSFMMLEPGAHNQVGDRFHVR